MADTAASPSALLDDAASLRFFDERVRWQASQFQDAMIDVEVRRCARAFAHAHVSCAATRRCAGGSRAARTAVCLIPAHRDLH
jgi:hypothetical protein